MSNTQQPTVTIIPKQKYKASKKKWVLSTRENIPQKEIEQKLTTARIGLLLKHPFFGNMATRLKLVKADDWCETAATDGRHFFYNTRFIDSINNKECEWLFGHEVLHNVFDHLLRRDSRVPELFNIAADYVINLVLKDEKLGSQIANTLYDEQFRGDATEEVYDKLFKDCKQITGKTMEELAEMLCDEHIDGDGGKDGNKDDSGAPRLSEAERQAIKDSIKESIIASAYAAGAGNVPAGVARYISELTEPKLNWREILRQQIQSTIKTDFSFMSPNKKGISGGFVIPGMKKDEALELCVAIDMSGSISKEMAKDMLSEIKGIMEQYNEYIIHVWCFDTQVYGYETFRSDEGANIESYECKGGGGTSFNVNWEFMKDNDIEPKLFLMFTDGFTCDGWGDENYCDTIFCIIKNGTKDDAPHGVTIRIDD